MPNSLIKLGHILRILLDLPNHALFFYEYAYEYDEKCLNALFFIAVTKRAIG